VCGCVPAQPEANTYLVIFAIQYTDGEFSLLSVPTRALSADGAKDNVIDEYKRDESFDVLTDDTTGREAVLVYRYTPEGELHP
jgi:hypothetical protein